MLIVTDQMFSFTSKHIHVVIVCPLNVLLVLFRVARWQSAGEELFRIAWWPFAGEEFFRIA